MTDTRPPSMAEMMTTLVGWMDSLDKVATAFAKDRGRPELAPKGRGIAEDLETLAAWFEKNPAVAETIYRECFTEKPSPQP